MATGREIEPMDWLICVVLGHNWKYKCCMDHATMQNIRICDCCGKKQCGKYIHSDTKMTWSDRCDE